VWLNVLLIAILIAVGLYLLARQKGWIKRPSSADKAVDPPPAPSKDAGKMSPARRRFVTVYLIVLGIGFVFMEASLLGIDFPETPRVPEPSPIQGFAPSSESQQGGQPMTPTDSTQGNQQPVAQNSPTPKPYPVIEYVLPQSTIGSTPNMWLTVYGKNFSTTSQIRLNGRPAAMRILSSNLLAAQLSPAELVSVGTITIDVIDTDSRSSNALIVPINKPRVPLNVFFLWHPPINRELQLLLLVCFAGALGSYIHALKSATAYIGNGNMGESWFWWYISGPFLGMAMALIFYSVLRGGFLAGTPADEKVVNPFGVLAVGALVGMFADKAALKLGEIFETLFKSGDPRSDKLNAPTINSLDPVKIQIGTEPQTIKIMGERLGKVSTVRLDSTEVKPTFVSDKEVHFKLDPKDFTKPGTLNVSVVDPKAGASMAMTLMIVAPSGNADPPPQGGS